MCARPLAAAGTFFRSHPRLVRGCKIVAAVLVGIVLVAGAWVAFWTFWNPRVAVKDPRVLHRPRTRGTVQIVAAGDFAPADAALAPIREQGYHYPYGPTAPIFQRADIAFANLEAPITRSTDPFPFPKKYLYRIEPEATEAFQWLGLDLVSNANNHAIDYRDRGLVDTLRFLRAAGIEPLGAGRNEAEARRGVVVDVGGTRIGFLGYLEDSTQYNLYFRTFAVGGRIGCARLEPDDVREDVRRMRRRADLVFVSVHWGDNYRPSNDQQHRDARMLADAGVDVVLGHHAHDVQEVQKIGRTLVLYSLGNYAWGAIGSDKLRVGLIARFEVTPRQGGAAPRVTGAELLPIVTQNRLVHFRPRRVRAAEMKWLAPMIEASRAAGVPLEIQGTRIRIPMDADPE